MTVDRTERGFEIIRFDDRNGQKCTLQQSSIADFEPPGSSAVWFGVGSERMHLSLTQLQELLPYLQRWAETGSFQP